jgi:hypothetical protein
MKVSYNKAKEFDLNRRVYQCLICDKLFQWDKNSSWFGSDRDEEEHPKRIKYFCSRECFKQFDKDKER